MTFRLYGTGVSSLQMKKELDEVFSLAFAAAKNSRGGGRLTEELNVGTAGRIMYSCHWTIFGYRHINVQQNTHD